MNDPFESAVAALWSSLGLPAPSFGRNAEATLTIDGHRLTIALTPDEARVLVSAEVGRLAGDPVVAEDQLRRLLRDSAGLMLLKGAAIRVRSARADDPSRGDVVEAQAIGPCQAGATPQLRRCIEDVLFLVEAHAETLKPGSSRTVHAPKLGAADLEGSLIFRL